MPSKPLVDKSRTSTIANAAFSYCKHNKMDTTCCILVDMSLHSGTKRLMVWDFQGDSILLNGLVSHGCCQLPWGSDQSRTSPFFSNVDGSHCTSLGKYRIGKRGYSNWGINVNYLMHGLESTNSNALTRQIVLHSWNEVPVDEVYPAGTPEGWGCPAVANEVMMQLDELLKRRSMPVLMWIYH